jgi:hypothetical protein
MIAEELKQSLIIPEHFRGMRRLSYLELSLMIRLEMAMQLRKVMELRMVMGLVPAMMGVLNDPGEGHLNWHGINTYPEYSN